uniref:Uncharacterized protein n=1 Tax=Tanacetum cinerariifolium TaxID=118510 RepID=A0A6L2KQ98_TANCI|nr:hypothetical protein [Tanacetum cinerariifolium]
MKETPYELLKKEQKKQVGKNNEVKMTLYNTLPGNSQVKNCKIDILTQEYEKLSISIEETIDSGFTTYNAIENDDVSSKTNTKDKIISLAIKAKVTREQTSDDSDSQGGSDEDIDEEKEGKSFNLLARNFGKFFRQGNRFERGN